MIPPKRCRNRQASRLGHRSANLQLGGEFRENVANRVGRGHCVKMVTSGTIVTRPPDCSGYAPEWTFAVAAPSATARIGRWLSTVLRGPARTAAWVSRGDVYRSRSDPARHPGDRCRRRGRGGPQQPSPEIRQGAGAARPILATAARPRPAHMAGGCTPRRGDRSTRRHRPRLGVDAPQRHHR